ncbi:MAG: hypothetical protein DWP97_13145 [Calditrichaeota bacterium]|nr:MAG: hypothetical protein DWP97_13145 [Calditrichota bacterium]
MVSWFRKYLNRNGSIGIETHCKQWATLFLILLAIILLCLVSCYPSIDVLFYQNDKVKKEFLIRVEKENLYIKLNGETLAAGYKKPLYLTLGLEFTQRDKNDSIVCEFDNINVYLNNRSMRRRPIVDSIVSDDKVSYALRYSIETIQSDFYPEYKKGQRYQPIKILLDSTISVNGKSIFIEPIYAYEQELPRVFP